MMVTRAYVAVTAGADTLGGSTAPGNVGLCKHTGTQLVRGTR